MVEKKKIKLVDLTPGRAQAIVSLWQDHTFQLLLEELEYKKQASLQDLLHSRVDVVAWELQAAQTKGHLRGLDALDEIKADCERILSEVRRDKWFGKTKK